MILHALNSLYERLADDPESGIASYGYSRERIDYEVILDENGGYRIAPLLTSVGSETKPGKRMAVPHHGEKRTVNNRPFFAWDNSEYIFGVSREPKHAKRAALRLELFKELHHSQEDLRDIPVYEAFVHFLNAQTAGSNPEIEDIDSFLGAKCVFRLSNTTSYLHDESRVRERWLQMLEASQGDQSTGQCLITGKNTRIADLHPAIKGVVDPGGQAEKGLCTFNLNAFQSYGKTGKTRGLNAAVCNEAAFAYTTALNRLLDPNRGRRMRVGNTSVVFWTEGDSPAEPFIADLLNPSGKADAKASAEDETRLAEVRDMIDAIAHGKFPPQLGEPGTRFYVLGLAPNAARISIRFWHVDTLGDFVEKLHRHFADLDIARGAKDLPHPPLWRLLRETVRDAKDIPDLLEGALLRAVLSGQHYPQMFFAALLRRIQADREVRFVRAAAIKACLNRNYMEELSVALDPDRPDQAYQLGRLFAELEKTQKDALNVNDTIKDRFFGAAMATPGSVFPRLVKLSTHHLGKLPVHSRTYHDRRIQAITGNIESFPSHHSMQQQGLFAIGYYHQRQDIFTKKTNAEDAPEPAAAE